MKQLIMVRVRGISLVSVMLSTTANSTSKNVGVRWRQVAEGILMVILYMHKRRHIRCVKFR